MSFIVEVLVPPLEHSLSYSLPAELAQVSVGYRVNVPLGKNSLRYGFVIEKHQRALEPRTKQTLSPQLALNIQSTQLDISKLKAVQSFDCPYPVFNQKQLEFFNRVAQYYAENLANVLDLAIPTPTKLALTRSVSLIKEPSKRSSRAKEIANFIISAKKSSVPIADIKANFQNCEATLRKMEHDGVIKLHSLEASFETDAPLAPWAKQDIALSETQKVALEKIINSCKSSNSETFLLHGVTGSGKTEVYIEAIRYVLSKGQSALVIVPEIALTPQVIDRFRARLSTEVAILHSALSKRERWSSWRALLKGQAKVAIGARSGIFAPFEDLGLIVVDEEHDSSYKQNDGLRYNARDLAVLRSQFESCPVILGSATPSLESFEKSRRGKYTLVSLPERPGVSLIPKVELIDLTNIRSSQMPTQNITTELFEALKEVLDKQEQAFVLYNRRGFASFLQCEECGEVLNCKNCSVTMTFHRYKQRVICHYCGLESDPPKRCIDCKAEKKDGSFSKFLERGAGTERVFDELKELFPNARIDRLDRDAASTLTRYKEILGRVRSGETQILVGTQMIAKGHDLPNVTLVGVVDCDIGLHMPDFRAAERGFQLLTQAAGRSGRAEKAGRVLLQTRLARHIALRKTVDHDYLGFAENELRLRKGLLYPPYCRLVRIIAGSSEPGLPFDTLLMLKQQAKLLIDKLNLAVTILGPVSAPLIRIDTLWRYHILLKSQSAVALNHVVSFIQKQRTTSGLKLTIDIDPQEML